MACNSCAKPYTLFRKEKGCPSCGFSYCSKCLNQTIFVKKLNSDAKVCMKCSNSNKLNLQQQVEPPAAYYKLVESAANGITNKTEEKIKQRLQNLKDDKSKELSEDKIREQLKNLKDIQPSTSTADLESRLANLRGIPVSDVQNKQILWAPDLKTEQQKADDLLKCYLEQVDIDKKYKDGFDKNIENIESRIQKLKGTTTEDSTKNELVDISSDDEETEIKKLIEKIKAESLLDDVQSTNEELPFCEICNEDAKMRCLGCRYLFCKRCFTEHMDDDDGCNKYERYESPEKI